MRGSEVWNAPPGIPGLVLALGSIAMRRSLILFAVLLMAPSVAQAYIGPGVGVGAITAALGVIGSIFLALVAVIYYPIKRLLKARRHAAGKDGGSDAGA